MKSPCYQCISRYPACHGGCEKYAAFRMQLDKENERRRREKELDDYQKKTAARMLKRRNQRGERGYEM